MTINTKYFLDAETRTELTETADSRVSGAPDIYKAGVDAGECKALCSSDIQCVVAMFDGSNCFFYYIELPVVTQSGSTVFMKVEITSSRMLQTGILHIAECLQHLIESGAFILIWNNVIVMVI